MDKLLTVAITTYNRKQSLLETLRSFEAQGMFEKYKIVISNNCSDYNVEEWLKHNLSSQFYSIIKLHNRPYNVGADVNIAFTFQLCDTKWMWLMSDDDISVPGSLQIVLNDISAMPDIAHIKYSIDGFGCMPDKICDNLNEVLDCYTDKSLKSGTGQFVFMSTNVINLEKVKPYIGNAPYYAHTCITQLIPSIFAIYNDKAKWKLSGKSITRYEHRATSSDFLAAIALNFTNIPLLDIEFTGNTISKFRKLFRFELRRSVIAQLMKIRSNKKRKQIFYRMWSGYYSWFSIRGWALFFYFFLNNTLKNLNVVNKNNSVNRNLFK